MKTALVMGITGGFGSHVADALLKDGWQVRAMMRDTAKLPTRFKAVEAVAGDAANVQDVQTAAEGADLIVYGINAPYPKWEGTVVPMLDVTASVAEQNGITVLFPGNVYFLNPKDGSEFDESAPINPPTRKGELRAEMEARLKTAASNGAKVIILRCGDFIGTNAQSWLQHLVKPSGSGYALQAAGDPGLVHTYAYLPDVARAAVKLVANVNEYAKFNVFHFKGYRVNFHDIARAIEAATGRPVKLGRFPWWALRLVSPFAPLLRSLIEMRYLWQSEVNLSDNKLESYLGAPVQITPLGDALRESGVLQHPADTGQGELKRA